MNLDAFVRSREGAWTELDGLVRKARGRPERLGPDGVRQLGALYRGAVADLARGRSAAPGDPAVRTLEELVNRARATIYVGPPRQGSARQYLARGYWRSVREHGRFVVVAWALLLGSAALATIWAAHDPGAATGVVPGSIAGGGGGPNKAIGLAAGQAAVLSIAIFTNNIGVTFASFASGILLGIGPAFSLLYNGLLLGAVVGIASATGHGTSAAELILPHGVLELSCIAVAAAAGMRMGWALVEPGSRGRVEALAATAPRSVLLVLATAPWLVLAGMVEGFVTPHHLPLPAAVAIGVGLAAPYWALVVWLGRAR